MNQKHSKQQVLVLELVMLLIKVQVMVMVPLVVTHLFIAKQVPMKTNRSLGLVLELEPVMELMVFMVINFQQHLLVKQVPSQTMKVMRLQQKMGLKNLLK